MRLADLLTRLSPHSRPWPGDIPGPLVVVTGAPGPRAATGVALLARLAALDPDQPAATTVPAAWPFADPRPVTSNRGRVVWAPDLHDAFVNAQTNATRLVTTHPAFVMQEWVDALATDPRLQLVATADRSALDDHAPEALQHRGAWRLVHIIDATEAEGDIRLETPAQSPLARAFRATAPVARLEATGRALDTLRSPTHVLAMASVCMEINDLENAGALLDEAVASAPTWAAAHFELGKLRLRREDMPGAAEAFGTACRLMPAFASAAANWGATLGELDRRDEALDAFRLALAADPDNPQTVNNIGVVSRELGRLAESEAAFRRVIALTPDLAFGHYNLGHTLFLQGRYHASLAAYQAGQAKDASRSPVQASRLAMARLAAGDAPGALRDLQGCTAILPPDLRRQVLSDTQSIAWALLSAAPDLRDWRLVGDWLATELARA